MKVQDLRAESLTTRYGPATFLSPLRGSYHEANFVQDGRDRILCNVLTSEQGDSPASFELAGPRERIFWNPATVRVAVVTCGGLAPGLNKVLQSIVTVLENRYGVREIFGVPFGYQGFTRDAAGALLFPWRRLSSAAVQNIDFEAGSILGSGRGHSNPVGIADTLQSQNIQLLFTLGGDGTLAGAHALQQETDRRGLPLGIVGVPKTIDNDIPCVSKSFGFESAVGKAMEALRCAQTEARGAFHGIGLVKLMGRDCGLLTATAAAAMNDLDFVLIPEVPLVMDGPQGFLESLLRRIQDKGYATVAVAEGAGQDLFEASASQGFDASGNARLADIGQLLKGRILAHMARRECPISLKYIEPSYMLRAQTTSAEDSVFCATLGQHAVHAGMAGKTGLLVGYAHERFTHVPLSAIQGLSKRLDTGGPIWLSVLASTGQPSSWTEGP